MPEIVCKEDYERSIAATRDERMAWWREARFGMFIHYGLYSQEGRNEWVQARENYTVDEYEKLADAFETKPGAPREWAELAKAAGMKYMVLTTRHHEGFSLWDSSANPYNSVNHGPKRDIVKAFVEACREFDLRIGFYSSVMDWHHPDGWRCAFDNDARKRFNDYLTEINRELLTQYGKIDILWYDVPRPLESWEAWNALERNQILREIQPHIIINPRSRLAEDFGTPEGRITAEPRDWEACMTFNDISWGYVDSEQAAPYSYTPQRIVRMLNKVTGGSGNLLLNIGPKPDGSVPDEAVAPLRGVGAWLERHAEAVYGNVEKCAMGPANGVCGASKKGTTVYFWNWIWPKSGTLAFGGFATPLKGARLLTTGEDVTFEQAGHRIVLKNLPEKSPDPTLGIAVVALEFEEEPEFHRCSYYPQLHGGKVWTNGDRA